jgi:hypothetical protein
MTLCAYKHDAEGLSLVYEGDNRVVGLKNYQLTNNILNFRELERHLETDEQFVLLEGSCLMVTLKDDVIDPAFEFTWLQIGVLYNVPKGLWHATVMTPGTKMIIIENSGTTTNNSERRNLTRDQIAMIQDFYSK